LLVTAAVWLLLPTEVREANPDRSTDVVVAALPSIAVLPFMNIGNNPDQEYFADGITEDLITDLSQIQGLDVVARNSIFAYKGSGEHEQVIGRDLGVQYVLKGAVQRSLNRLRLNVQLISVTNGRTLWAQRYDRELGDIFQIQDELAARIVSAMEVELAPADRRRLDRNYIASIESYDEFLKGLDYYGRRSPDDGLLAKVHYRKAIELDPGFARPYAGLALTYTRELTEGWGTSVDESLEQAYDLAQKALQLDPSIPQLYFAMSQVKLFQRDHRAAIEHIEKAITLNSSYADGYALMAWILQFAGRPQEGLGFMQRAMRLNPRTPAIYLLVLGSIHYALGNPSQAVELLQTGAEISPAFQRLRVWLAAAYAASGDAERAAWEIAEVLAINPAFSLKLVETAFPSLDPLYRDRFINDLRKAGMTE
jgi:TolB-like protein